METTPYEPPGLRELIKNLKVYPGWVFSLKTEYSEDGSGGLTFFVISNTQDSMNSDKRIRVRHGFLVPPASYNRNSWVAWLRDRLADVNNHELGEFFRINGVREFAPHHSNGENPYIVWHVGDWETANKKSGDE